MFIRTHLRDRYTVIGAPEHLISSSSCSSSLVSCFVFVVFGLVLCFYTVIETRGLRKIDSDEVNCIQTTQHQHRTKKTVLRRKCPPYAMLSGAIESWIHQGQ